MVATGWRSLRVVASSPVGAVARAVDVDGLNGGLRLDPDEALPGAYRVTTLRGGKVELLLPGEFVTVNDHRLVLETGDRTTEAEILRRDWTVFASAKGCGHRRVDFGADPLGRLDGVRDRVVLPKVDGLGWFYLVPSDGECFRFDDRGGSLVVERDGLVLRVGGVSRVLVIGDRVPVRRGFEVLSASPAMEVRVSWESVTRARPVVSGGAVIGYRDESGVDFVVRSSRAGEARSPSVRIESDDELVAWVALGEGSTILFGRDDRVGPLTGRVLPSRAPNEELESAFRSGLADGWINPEGGRTGVDVPRDVSIGTARSLVGLLDAWDRARAPVALRFDGLVPAAGVAEDRRGQVPLRWNDALKAWLPSHRPFADGPVTFRVPVRPGVEVVTVAAAFPLAYGRDLTLLPAPAYGRWMTHRIPVDGAVLRLRLDARPPPEHRTEQISVVLAGGPDGTRLNDVHTGRRAFDGWQDATDETAARAWDRVDGDRWRVERSLPAPTQRPRPGFVRVPLSSPTTGWVALDLTLPGPAREAGWNGGAVALARLPSAPGGGTTRVSLLARPGKNVLTVRFDQLPTAPAREAGGVRFAVDRDGEVLGLDDRVADRLARPSVVVAGEALERTIPALVVASGIPGLEASTTWRPGAAAELLFADAGTVRKNLYGEVELTSEGLQWRNGPAMALGVVRRVETDPDGPPLAGFRVAPTALQPLHADGDAIVGPIFRTELRASIAGEIDGTTVVVGLGGRHQLRSSGDPGWFEEEVDRIAVRTVHGRLQVKSSVPATLWSSLGDSRAIEDVWSPWPDGARISWTLPTGTLRLVHAGIAAPRIVGDTVEVPLQLAAESALTRVVGDSGLDDGDSLALRAAVLALDAETGDVLACASRDRADANPRTRALSPCWQDVGLHPGSTFKVGVATAALASDDPLVRRMVDGRLPPGLTKGGARSGLRGARLPGREDGRGQSLRSRLRNHRGHLMATDATLEDALRSSLNTWFGYMGLLLHEPLREGWGSAGIADVERTRAGWGVADVAYAAGFGRRIDLGGGHVGTGGRFSVASVEGDAPLAARSIGQGDVTATPLGIATLLAPVVAGGLMPVPRVDRGRAMERRKVLDTAAADRLRAALHEVVLRGTASRAFSDHPQRELLLGKTGSAQRVDADGVSRTDAWFVGAVVPPVGVGGRPVVIVAVVPGGGLGGRLAAEVVDALSRDLILQRGWDTPPSS